MRRRKLLAVVGAFVVAWPLAARAQQPAMPMIGFLNAVSPDVFASYVAAFKQGLGQVGYAEGRNVAIEYRWALGQYDRLPDLARELASARVSVIAAGGGSMAALAAKAASARIPIVFTFGDGDPERHGLVASFSRPGGNVTGITMIAGALEPKRLELLRELAPAATVIHVLFNPTNTGMTQDIPELAEAGRAVGVRVQVVPAATPAGIDAAFASLVREGAKALMVVNDGFFTARAAQIAGLAARHAIPTVYPWREFVAAGGLMSYGASIREAYRQAGIYVGQILKGTNPADLPVQRPTRFEAVLNLKAAKALGLDVPTSVLLRADEVIE